MRDDADGDVPTVAVVCPACDTSTRVSIERISETIDRHNDRQHDGEAMADIDPAVKDELARLVAQELELL